MMIDDILSYYICVLLMLLVLPHVYTTIVYYSVPATAYSTKLSCISHASSINNHRFAARAYEARRRSYDAAGGGYRRRSIGGSVIGNQRYIAMYEYLY